MSILKPERLRRLIDRFKILEAQLSGGTEGEAFVRLSREYAELEPVAKAAQTLLAAYAERDSLAEMIAAGGELAEMAEAEGPILNIKIEELEKHVRLMLLPAGPPHRLPGLGRFPKGCGHLALDVPGPL